MTPPKDNLPLVSIITVVYNNRVGLEATLLNILQQTYQAVELLVIDGGSTDGTQEIIDKYKGKIAYSVSERDRGLYDAMNKGIRAAKGEYLWFINTSDYIESPDVLQNIYDRFGLKDDIYYGETHFIDDSGKVLGTRSQLTTRKVPETLDWKSKRLGQVVSHQSFIVRRSIAPEYDLKYRFSSDVDWAIKCLKQAKTVVNTKMVLSRYLVGGFSKTNQQKGWKERFDIFVKHYGLLDTIVYHTYFVFRAIKFKVMRG